MNKTLQDKALTVGGLAGLCIGLLFLAAAQMGVEGFSSGGGVLPTGAIVMTLNGTCPALYAESTEFRGRVAAGMPVGGTIGGTMGTAMANLEPRLPIMIVEGTGVIGTPAGAVPILSGHGNCGTAPNGTCKVYNQGLDTLIDATHPLSESSLPYVQVLYCVKL